MTAGNWIALGSFALAFMGFLVGIFQRFSSRIETQTAKIGVDLQGLRQQVTDDIKGLDERLRFVESNKVSHADWVRAVAGQNNRMNRVSDQLSELSGKVDASIGLGASLNRVASAIERKASEKPNG